MKSATSYSEAMRLPIGEAVDVYNDIIFYLEKQAEALRKK